MVRPIVLQDNLAKTQAAERMNQIQKAHGEMEQRQVAEALKQKASADTTRTRESEKTDMVIIRNDKERERSGKEDREEKKRQPGQDETEEEETRDHLDLRG